MPLRLHYVTCCNIVQYVCGITYNNAIIPLQEVEGNIDQDEYYVCYAVQKDGGLYLVKFPADETVIYETLEEGEQAYATFTQHNVWGNFTNVKLYVPKGIVQVEYDLSTSSP